MLLEDMKHGQVLRVIIGKKKLMCDWIFNEHNYYINLLQQLKQVEIFIFVALWPKK